MQFEQLLLSNVAAVSVTVVFIWYLIRKDKLNKDTYDRFSNIVENHLHQSNTVIKNATKTNVNISATLTRLSGLIEELIRKTNGK